MLCGIGVLEPPGARGRRGSGRRASLSASSTSQLTDRCIPSTSIHIDPHIYHLSTVRYEYGHAVEVYRNYRNSDDSYNRRQGASMRTPRSLSRTWSGTRGGMRTSGLQGAAFLCMRSVWTGYTGSLWIWNETGTSWPRMWMVWLRARGGDAEASSGFPPSSGECDCRAPRASCRSGTKWVLVGEGRRFARSRMRRFRAGALGAWGRDACLASARPVKSLVALRRELRVRIWNSFLDCTFQVQRNFGIQGCTYYSGFRSIWLIPD